MTHRVDIGLPVYNGSKYLSKAIESVLKQSFTNWRLVIADNASTDASLEIARRHAEQDRRISILTADRNRGAAWNYNRLVSQATGAYFKWLAHDDLWDPTLLQYSVETLDEASRDVILVYPHTRIVNERGQTVSSSRDVDVRSLVPHERLSLVITHLGRCNAVFGLFRLPALRKTRLIGAYPGSDRVLLAELALQGQLWLIGDSMFYRRFHDEGSTFANASRRAEAVWFAGDRPSALYRVPTSRRFIGVANAIHHASLTHDEKVRCWHVLGRDWLRRYGREMASEVSRSSLDPLRRLSPAARGSDRRSHAPRSAALREVRGGHRDSGDESTSCLSDDAAAVLGSVHYRGESR